MYFTYIAIIQSPQNQSICEGGTVNFKCVIMFPVGSTPGGAAWYTERGSDATSIGDHTATNDANGRSPPPNVTNTQDMCVDLVLA